MSKLTAYDKFIQQALKYGFSLYGTAKTGQVTQYYLGDDGTHKKGYPSAGVRFVDNGDGTITDKASGLMWVKDGNGAGTNNGQAYSWLNAIAWGENMSFAGYNDWRIPNIKEFMSIIDFKAGLSMLDTVFFIGAPPIHIWLSTTHKTLSTKAYAVPYTSGGEIITSFKTTLYVTRPCRGGI